MTPRLEKLLQLLKESPEDSFVTFAIAKEYEGMNDVDKAMEHYHLLIEHDPDYVGTYFHLGKCYVLREDFDRAIAVYEQGMLVAKKIGDKHSLSELAGAKMEIEE